MNNNLDLNNDGSFNPRLIFGSDSDADHVYNNPRAWYMARYFNKNTFDFDTENADFKPDSNNIPWALKPERKITIEDVKYILSSYYQGTKYNPYQKANYPEKGIYRPIGINRTGVTSICQIRNNVADELKGVEWISYGPNAFNTILPLYTNVDSLPKYVSATTLDVDTESFYWQSRLINALADPNYGTSIMFIERYQNKTMAQARGILAEFDKKFNETKDVKVLSMANDEICKMVKKESTDTLGKVLHDASVHMKNGYSRADN